MIREENRKRRKQKTRGLTGLTVNSCFSYLPLAYLIILNIYILIFIYVWEVEYAFLGC